MIMKSKRLSLFGAADVGQSRFFKDQRLFGWLSEKFEE